MRYEIAVLCSGFFPDVEVFLVGLCEVYTSRALCRLHCCDILVGVQCRHAIEIEFDCSFKVCKFSSHPVRCSQVLGIKKDANERCVYHAFRIASLSARACPGKSRRVCLSQHGQLLADCRLCSVSRTEQAMASRQSELLRAQSCRSQSSHTEQRQSGSRENLRGNCQCLVRSRAESFGDRMLAARCWRTKTRGASTISTAKRD